MKNQFRQNIDNFLIFLSDIFLGYKELMGIEVSLISLSVLLT